MVKIIVIDNDQQQEIDAKIGESIMEAAIRGNVNIEAACGGSLSCATCHLIVDQAWYDTLLAPDSDEKDMLDFADNVTQTSRLSCQVKVTEALDGIKLFVPKD